ncbi:hypothetical protein D1007_44198 [Hordeum vulgare]|nr:hypothetical protein D1007_44198 [Hordeum vulgare]
MAMDAMSSAVLQGGWRKGPWTALEDRLLTEYVQQQGEGSWNSVAKLTGLRRSGKSCRLRWVNYLRPDLKRGKITPDEESVILHLHAMLGNRIDAHVLYLYLGCAQWAVPNYATRGWMDGWVQVQSPQDADLQAVITVGNMNNNMETAECYCPCPAESAVLDLPLPAADEDALWDSLWRLVDGEDGSSGGDSGEC